MKRLAAILLIPLALTAAVFLAAPACAAERAVQPPRPVVMPPLPPSPVDQFRQWLRMDSAARETALAAWPSEKRVVLREKLRAYDGLTTEQQERRLQMLELRWYLLPLMNSAPAERTNQVSLIPLRLHGLVQARLDQWDKLEERTRGEILASEKARDLVASYLAHIQRGRTHVEVLNSLNEAKRREMELALRHWNATSEADRGKMAAKLSEFFTLPPRQQAKTLVQFSDLERADMQKTLDAFAVLPPAERRVCVDSFQKFATMTPAQRNAFLQNASRWQAMSPAERDSWRLLVQKLPPMPAGPTPMPPSLPLPGTNAGRPAAGG